MLQGKLPIMAFVYDESFTKAIATFWALFNVIESSALYLSWQQCIIFLFNHSGLSMESWRLTLFGKHTFKVITIFCEESYDYNFRVTFFAKNMNIIPTHFSSFTISFPEACDVETNLTSTFLYLWVTLLELSGGVMHF